MSAPSKTQSNDRLVGGVHPQAPSGAPGPGRFRSPLPWGDPTGAPFHNRPEMGPVTIVSKSIFETVTADAEWLRENIVDLTRRALAVLRAFEIARERYTAQAILKETGHGLQELVGGLLPGLLLMLAVLATTTAIGGLAGAAIGALAGGVGALPGAAAGAKVGFSVGVAILEWLGIGFLIVYIGSRLGEVATRLGDAVKVAWDAGESGNRREVDIDAAAQEIARAVAILFRLILEGIVLYLTARGIAAASERLPGLISRLKASKLGKGFAEWVEKNYKSLIEDPRLNPALREKGGGTAPSSGGGSSRNGSPGTKTKEEPGPVRSTGRVVSRQEAEQLLLDKGFKPERAKSFIDSFDDGPITVREAQPGETFYRYSGRDDGKGSFLTQSKYSTPQEAVDGLYLGPYNNPATYRQAVTTTSPSTVLEGGVRNGQPPGAQQTLLTNLGDFAFGTGEKF